MTSHVRMVVVLGAVVALLGGCAATDVPTPTQTTSTTAPSSAGPTPSAMPIPTPTPTPTPKPTASAAGVPETCEALLPLATISGELGEPWHPIDPDNPSAQIPGPQARAAAAAAIETLPCLWGPDAVTEGYLLGYAFRLDPAARVDLVDALGEASSYRTLQIEGADIAFSTSELRGDLRHTTIYAFAGDVWIVLIAPLYDIVLTGFAEEALDAALAAG